MMSRSGSQALAVGARSDSDRLGGGPGSVDTSPVVAGFQVSITGHIWVSTEVLSWTSVGFSHV